MRESRRLPATLLVAVLGIGAAGPAPAAQPGWRHGYWEDSWEHIQLFIDDCGPSDVSGIRAAVWQIGRSAPYTIHVWCRPDHSGKTYEVDMLPWDGHPALGDGFADGDTALIGFYYSQVEGNEKIWVVRER